MQEHTPTPETRQLVELLALAGMRQSQIASAVGEGISIPTLKKHYGPLLEVAKIKRLGGVAGMAYTLAMGRPAIYDPKTGALLHEELKPDRSMVQFILRTQAGWKETIGVELTDPTAGARDRLAGIVAKQRAAQLSDGDAAPGPAEQSDPARLN